MISTLTTCHKESYCDPIYLAPNALVAVLDIIYERYCVQVGLAPTQSSHRMAALRSLARIESIIVVRLCIWSFQRKGRWPTNGFEPIETLLAKIVLSLACRQRAEQPS